jgi:hypothetical protein
MGDFTDMREWSVVKQDYVAGTADDHGLIEATKVFLKKPNGSLILYYEGYQRRAWEEAREAEKIVEALNKAQVMCEEPLMAGKL